MLSLIGIIVLSYVVGKRSDAPDKLKNAALVLTGGSIIIGIFYSIINYEHNQLKFKHDVKTSREVLTFTTATKMYDKEMINHFRNVKTFYQTNKEFFVQNRCLEIDRLLTEETEKRVSFIVLFNYLEGISVGINQGIMDEVFMKEFFKTLFRDYSQYFGLYLDFLRKESNSPRIFRHFTALAERWNKEI